MIEEKNNIFLASGDALVYLAGPMQKKYSTIFIWSHPFNTYVSFTDFSTPPPPCKHMYVFRVTVTAVKLFQKILLNTIAHMY